MSSTSSPSSSAIAVTSAMFLICVPWKVASTSNTMVNTVSAPGCNSAIGLVKSAVVPLSVKALGVTRVRPTGILSATPILYNGKVPSLVTLIVYVT